SAGLGPAEVARMAYMAYALMSVPAADFNRRAGPIRDALNAGDKNGALRAIGLTPDSSTAAARKMESDLEATYFRGQLDKPQPHPGVGVLYDKNAKPAAEATATELASSVSKTAPVRVADAGDDLNLEVRAAAGHLVGQKVVGSGECFDLGDKVLRDAGA